MFVANSIEHFSGLRAHVYVRFGKWQEIIDQPLPDDPVLFPVSTAYWFYAKGIAHASMATGVPVIFGVITADTIEQAIERAGTKAGNAGAKAAISAIEMANLLKKL